MNRMKYLIVLGLAAFAFGCPARSLFPLFAEKDLKPLPAGVKTWILEKRDTVTFQADKGMTYRVTVRFAGGGSGQYIAQVGKLGDAWFLDSYPADNDIDGHLIPSHIISRIRIQRDTAWIASLDSDWLEKMIHAGKLSIPHVERDGEIILTASTEQLQELALRHADDPDAFQQTWK